MKDFLLSALPYLIIGICIAIICANFKKIKQSYCSEGMAIGMGLGVAISTSLNYNNGLGVSLGMLVGETIGILIKREK